MCLYVDGRKAGGRAKDAGSSEHEQREKRYKEILSAVDALERL